MGSNRPETRQFITYFQKCLSAAYRYHPPVRKYSKITLETLVVSPEFQALDLNDRVALSNKGEWIPPMHQALFALLCLVYKATSILRCYTILKERDKGRGRARGLAEIAVAER